MAFSPRQTSARLLEQRESLELALLKAGMPLQSLFLDNMSTKACDDNSAIQPISTGGQQNIRGGMSWGSTATSNEFISRQLLVSPDLFTGLGIAARAMYYRTRDRETASINTHCIIST